MTIRSFTSQAVRMTVLLGSFVATAAAEDQRVATVGMPARIDQIVIAGPELVARPIDDDTSTIVLRIVETFPHGSDFRYDLVYYGLEPGAYDLVEFLQHTDGSPPQGVPPIEVRIEPVLPAGQIEPNKLSPTPVPRLGGYQTWLIVAGIIWLLGLPLILLIGRRRRQAVRQRRQPTTLAERLQPIVVEAIEGKAPQSKLAELERLLVTYWRRRLDLEHVRASEAIAALRVHPEAGALLNALERWLHAPGSSEEVDLAELLRPYRNLPPDALELKPGNRAARTNSSDRLETKP